MILLIGKHTRRRPMETWNSVFGKLMAFVYHCFDRIVIQGYLPLLSRPAHIVHFFRDVHGIYPITPQALAKRTHGIPGMGGGLRPQSQDSDEEPGEGREQ